MRFDDSNLLVALQEGMFESPPWRGFLDQLRRRTGAFHASILFRPVGEEALAELRSGDGPAPDFRWLIAGGAAGVSSRQMRDGRVYATDELIEGADPSRRPPPEALAARAAIGNGRIMRVAAPDGFDVWLGCAGPRDLGWSAVSAVMAMLAPHLRVALRTFAALEREQFRSTVASETFSRLDFGWLTLDARGRIIDQSQHMEQLFARTNVLQRGRYDRLTPASPVIDRALTGLLRLFAADGQARPRAINLSRDPLVDMLVRPIEDRSLAAHSAPVAIAYVSGDRWSQADRCDQLVNLFGLLPSEARVAWAIAQGMSIAEAADKLGLTIETARNYSKKIYAKTGSRGQAELVRNILGSALALT